MINKILSRIDTVTKTRMLGPEVLEWLKGTYSEGNLNVINEKLIDPIISSQFLNVLYRSYLDHVVDSLKVEDLNRWGFDDYDHAFDSFKKSPELFARLLEVDVNDLQESSFSVLQSSELIIPTYGEVINSIGAPHTFQLRIKKEIQSNLKSINPILLVVMPTGAGKTMTAMEVIADFIRSGHGTRVLWVVNKKELLEQSIESFRKLWSQKGDSQVQVERFYNKYDGVEFLDNKGSALTFAGFDLLTSRLNGSKVKQLLQATDLVFVDEVHYSGATTYAEVLEAYRDINPSFKIIGLTATPHRNDSKSGEVFRSNFSKTISITDGNGQVLASPLNYLIKNDYLSRIQFKTLSIDQNIDKYSGELNQKVVEECLNLELNGKRTVIFAKSRSHAIALNLILRNSGVRTDLIIGQTPDSKRLEILDELRNGSISTVVNHEILSAGLDVPGLESIMILADIESPSLGMQILGRAMRGVKNGGNKSNIVYVTPSNRLRFESFGLLEEITLKY